MVSRMSSGSDAMMPIDYAAIARAGGIPKPEPRKRTKRRAKREKADRITEMRLYVFARERNLCRCCRLRPAESMHEIRPRSLGGKVSKTNSIALCGSGTTGCHGFCQTHQIAVFCLSVGAEGDVLFRPDSRAAAEWLRIKVGAEIITPPFRDIDL